MTQVSNPFETILNEIAELRADVRELRKLKAPENPLALSDKVTKEQALQIFIENGLPMKEGQFYFLTSTGELPSERIGKRLVLSRKEILNWIESKTVRRSTSKTESAQKLVESANRKLRAKS